MDSDHPTGIDMVSHQDKQNTRERKRQAPAPKDQGIKKRQAVCRSARLRTAHQDCTKPTIRKAQLSPVYSVRKKRQRGSHKDHKSSTFRTSSSADGKRSKYTTPETPFPRPKIGFLRSDSESRHQALLPGFRRQRVIAKALSNIVSRPEAGPRPALSRTARPEKIFKGVRGSYILDYDNSNDNDNDEKKTSVKEGCKSLLKACEIYPQDTLFRDDIFVQTSEKIRDRNEVIIIQDISRPISTSTS
ncbi:MAG: hypothetical protein Q9201_005546 [Fulgogasparrea decipioides]